MGADQAFRNLTARLIVVVIAAGCGSGSYAPPSARADQDNAGAFQVVGSHALFARGMNAALAAYDHYLYIGNRTDGSDLCPDGKSGCPHPHPGVLIMDVADTANPTMVGEIGPPDEGVIGLTSRELRVWPAQKLLIVMNFICSSVIHACPVGDDAQFPFDLKFFDLTDPIHPKLVSRYAPTSKAGAPTRPHEMFLWADPANASRALLLISTITQSIDPTKPTLLAVDISQATSGVFTELAEANFNQDYPGADKPENFDKNLYLHSMAMTPDGSRTYVSQEAGELLVVDSSAIAQGRAGADFKLLSDVGARPTWGNPNAHSSVKVPGRPLVVMTDELYGKLISKLQGCPWGWMHMVDISDESKPTLLGEFKAPENETSFCMTPTGADDKLVSFTAHNPTVLRDLALITWHSSGFYAVDITNPRYPISAANFRPDPLPSVAVEDPALSLGPSKLVMWSYPIIKDGLIYVIDIRNGLYILRYEGPYQDEIQRIRFLEGNSNLGDALSLESY
jgi:hypothetical protein